jgi:hypothetical protein
METSVEENEEKYVSENMEIPYQYG